MHDTLCACAFNSNLCAHRLAYVSAILCCINIIPYIYMYVDLHEDGFASGGDVRSGERVQQLAQQLSDGSAEHQTSTDNSISSPGMSNRLNLRVAIL